MTNNDKNVSMEETINEVYETIRDEKVSELTILQQSLEDKKKLAANYYDQLLRLKAEFENYRVRTEKEKQTHRLWGKEEVLLKQISLFDILEQAYNSIKSNANPESIQKGLELIKIEFSKMLSGEGITEIESVGKKFDPNIHEAMDYVRTDEAEEGTVIEVMMKGYMFNGRIIRPARVKVAQKKETVN